MGKDEQQFGIYKFHTMGDGDGADARRAALADRNEAGGVLFEIEIDALIDPERLAALGLRILPPDDGHR